MNESSLRSDGATRGDQIEATALIIAGVVLMCIPVLAVVDQLDTLWLFVSLAAGAAGLVIGGVGVRWFRQEGPYLESSLATADSRFLSLDGCERPVELRLIEAGQRFVAHCLRFVAFGSAGLIMLVELGPARWLVVAMFGTSFLADQWMLRPRLYTLNTDGLERRSLLAPLKISWSCVKTVYWRHYPANNQPPFPSGERLIFELKEGKDLEFVFRGSSAKDQAETMTRTLVAHLDNKVRILSPRHGRAEIVRQDVSEHLSPSAPDTEA